MTQAAVTLNSCFAEGGASRDSLAGCWGSLDDRAARIEPGMVSSSPTTNHQKIQQGLVDSLQSCACYLRL